MQIKLMLLLLNRQPSQEFLLIFIASALFSVNTKPTSRTSFSLLLLDRQNQANKKDSVGSFIVLWNPAREWAELLKRKPTPSL